MPNSRRKSNASSTSVSIDSQGRIIQKKRTSNFREDETRLLISLWGSPTIQNKLYLTHRKAPVMRILAANMQRRGFYRSPDEIKTRIRNLKCLYHRIKRTVVCGTGIGTVDPDWPHFKAMDAILSNQGSYSKQQDKQKAVEDALEGPRCEDIKQEVDLDINDDMESWVGNDSLGSGEYDDDKIQIPSPPALHEPPPPPPPRTMVPTLLPNLLPRFTMPAQPANSAGTVRPTGVPSIPLPLLILNHGLQPQQDRKDNSEGPPAKKQALSAGDTDLHNILKDILNVQKQNLELEKERLELEKQRLEFDRLVGTQLVTLVPMVGGLLQRMIYSQNVSDANSFRKENGCDKDGVPSEYNLLKDSKILRTVLERGIKKYMMSDDADKGGDQESENEEDGSIRDADENDSCNK